MISSVQSSLFNAKYKVQVQSVHSSSPYPFPNDNQRAYLIWYEYIERYIDYIIRCISHVGFIYNNITRIETIVELGLL